MLEFIYKYIIQNARIYLQIYHSKCLNLAPMLQKETIRRSLI